MSPQTSIARMGRLRYAPWVFVLPALCFGVSVLLLDWLSAYVLTVVFVVLHVVVIVPRFIEPDNRAGLVLLARRDYAAAHQAFVRSEAAWRARPLLDRWHMPLMMTANPHSMVAIAQNNQATALARMGKGDEAIALLERVTAEYPQLFTAVETLQLLKVLRGSWRDAAAAEASTG